MSNYRETHVGRITVIYRDAPDDVEVWLDFHKPTVDAGLWWYDQRRRSVMWFPPGSPAISQSLSLPSETLQSLLRHFHEHRAVAPLVDRLIEEYPDLEPYLAGVLDTATEGVA